MRWTGDELVTNLTVFSATQLRLGRGRSAPNTMADEYRFGSMYPGANSVPSSYPRTVAKEAQKSGASLHGAELHKFGSNFPGTTLRARSEISFPEGPDWPKNLNMHSKRYVSTEERKLIRGLIILTE